MKPLRKLLLLGTALFAATAWAADPLRMDLQNTFTGPTADSSVITVLLENDGPDARGFVRVTGETGDTTYPVELPRGARKKLLTLPEASWGELVFSLETDHGDVTKKIPSFPPANDMTGGSVLLIGDDNGGLGFLRKLSDGKQNYTTRDAYVTPEDAPDRPAAYRTSNVVMLGPGAERLSDGAVRALKDYALSGGALLFIGGPSAPILEDVRWASLIPGKGWRPKTLSRSPELSNLADSDAPGPFTVLSPDVPAAGGTIRWEGGTVLETERGYGLGRVIVLGYSPLEPPLSTWTGRGRLISRFIRSAEGQRARGFVGTYQISGRMGEDIYSAPPPVMITSTGAPAGVAPGTPYSMYQPQVSGDPFSTTLPPTSTVFGILAGYFVLVVPVSFLVLRKFKKGEFAWFTAPVLSLAFAGLLFKSAQGLYSASLSTATNGVLVLQEGSQNGMFFGTSQLFFPRGGVYDLKLSGVDRMTAVNQAEEYGFRARSNTLSGFNAVDVGEIKAPQLEADNLAFRDLSYSQRVDAGDWFRFRTVDRAHLRVENRSPYPFKGTLVNGSWESMPVEIRPGGQALVGLAEGNFADKGAPLDGRDLRNFTRSMNRIALHGTITGFRPGPQIGKEVENRSGITLVAFAQATAQGKSSE